MVLQPRGTVSLLFTDIEGSTRLVAALGKERYAELLEVHRGLLRDAFERHGGYEVDGEGDAFFVTFSTALDAVCAASAAQEALDGYAWPDGVEVRVRMGIHTGEPLVAPPRYVGLHVHRAARIGAAAHGGQVLVSPTTADLVGGELPEALSLRDLGRYQLKDFDRELHLFQLDRRGGMCEFPPLRTSSAALEPGTRGRLGMRARILASVAALLMVVGTLVAVSVFGGGSGGSGSVQGVPADSLVALDLRAQKLVASVPTGGPPGAVAVGRDAVWVAKPGDLMVWRIDPTRKQVIATIPIGAVPVAIAVSGARVWVAGDDGRLRLIDPVFNRVTRTFRLGPRPIAATAITVSPGAVWVANADGTVSHVDSRTGHLVARVEVGDSPDAITFGFGATWVANRASGTISRIDRADVVTSTTSVGRAPSAIVTCAGSVWIAVAGKIVRLSSSNAAPISSIRLGATPSAMATSAGVLWASSADGTLFRLDTRRNEIVSTLHFGKSLAGSGAQNGLLWISVQGDASAPVKASGGVLRLGGEDLGSLDPALGGQGLSYAVCAKLLNYPDAAGRSGTRLVPEIARALPVISDGGRTYSFTIRRGFRFSPPSNAAVTAQTLKFTIERTLNPAMHSYPALGGIMDDIVGAKAYMNGEAQHIKGVEARHNTLLIHLRQPAGDLPARLAMPYFCAVPPNTPVNPHVSIVPTAGPYYIASHVGGQITLARNPNYHGSRPRHFATIVYTNGIDETEAIARIKSGTLDYQPSAAYLPAQSNSIASFRPSTRAGTKPHYVIASTLNVNYLFLNTSRPPFSNVAFRKAVNYAIDRRAHDRLASGTSLDFHELTDEYLPPLMPGFRDASVYPLTHANLPAARRLMRGRRANATIYAGNDPYSLDQAQLIKTQLAPIGISVQIRTIPISVLFQRIERAGEPWDLVIVSVSADYVDPSDMLNVLFDSRYIADHPSFGGTEYFLNQDWSKFNDPAWNRKLEAAQRLSGSARYRAYGLLAIALAKEAAPAVAMESFRALDLFSARTGCVIEQPVYGVDLGVLCTAR